MGRRESYAPGEFCWVDLGSHGAEGARKFYGELFGWTTVQTGPEDRPYHQFLLGEEVVAGLGEMSDDMKAAGIPPMWNSYINVADVEATARRAEELGATITVPPMKVMDAGWLAFLLDLEGASIALWQRGTHHGATLVNDPGSFSWNELSTRDLKAASDFYRGLVGWDFDENPGSPNPYLIIRNDGRMNGGLLQMSDEWAGIPANWTVYFTVADVDEKTQDVRDLGGKVHVPGMDIPAGRFSVVTDPQGAHFTLFRPAEN